MPRIIGTISIDTPRQQERRSRASSFLVQLLACRTSVVYTAVPVGVRLSADAEHLGSTRAGRPLIVTVRLAGGSRGARDMSDAEREEFESWETSS